MARQPGILTPADRDKLTGKQSLDDYSNVSTWKGRIRESIRQANDDMSLLQASPHWDDDDFLKIYRDSHRNTNLVGPLSMEGVEKGADSATAQSKIYGDAVQKMAEELENVDIDGSWQESDDMQQAVQQMFVRNIVRVFTDVLEVQGVTDDDVVREFFEDVWPEKERALDIVENEL